MADDRTYVALAFEQEFAQYIGCKRAIAVNSATAALQLALDAIGLKAGDEVLLPTYTFTATAEVVTYFGARPVLCDSIPGGFNLDPCGCRAANHRADTRAIMPVHIAGEPCAMDRLLEMRSHTAYRCDRGCRPRSARQLSAGKRDRDDFRNDRFQFLRHQDHYHGRRWHAYYR